MARLRKQTKSITYKQKIPPSPENQLSTWQHFYSRSVIKTTSKVLFIFTTFFFKSSPLQGCQENLITEPQLIVDSMYKP